MAYTNETVTLTVKPNDGYELESITVVIADETSDLLPMQPSGKTVELIQGDDGNYTFKCWARGLPIDVGTLSHFAVSGRAERHVNHAAADARKI